MPIARCRLQRLGDTDHPARVEREAATTLADELALGAASGTATVAEALEHRVSRRVEPSTTMFATELALRLRDRHPALSLATAWLERRFAEQGTTLEEAIRAEHRSQAANQISVGNCITSMRTITATDWSKVFESLSVVERELRRDPSGTYPRMDFATRDRYRHVVERIGKRTGRPEHEVAERAVALALVELERSGEPAEASAAKPALSRARPILKPQRKPGTTAFKPPPKPVESSPELEELDSGVIEELDEDEVAEVVEKPAPPPRKAPPSRPKPPAKRPPPSPPARGDKVSEIKSEEIISE